MSIKQKIKSVWNKVKCKTDDKSKNDKSDCDGDSCKINSELAAEEVIQEEVFPAKKHAAKKNVQALRLHAQACEQAHPPDQPRLQNDRSRRRHLRFEQKLTVDIY